MPKPNSVLPHIDTIPSELCTREEAAKILGLRTAAALNLSNQRFSKLLYTEVVYKKFRVYLFNRKQVESLKYSEPPEGYITWREVDKLLGYNSNNNCTVLSIMKTYNVPRVWVKCHHSQFYYERKAVEALRGVIKPCRKRQRNGLD